MPHQWAFFLKQFIEGGSKPFDESNILVTPDVESAEEFFLHLKKNFPYKDIFLFRGSEQSPYSSIISSERNLFDQFRILDAINRNSEKKLIITPIEGLLLKLPPKEFFSKHQIELKTDDIISPFDLSKKLIELGYVRSTTVEEPGTFSPRGEIFDIYPISDSAVRIHFFDELIEEMYSINLENQRTLKDKKIENVLIGPCPPIFCQSEFKSALREVIPMPSPGFKAKFELRKEILQKIANGEMFENYPIYAPLFFKKSNTLLDYFDLEKTQLSLIEDFKISQLVPQLIEDLKTDFESVSADSESDNILPDPSFFYDFNSFSNIKKSKLLKIDEVKIETQDLDNLENSQHVQLESSLFYLKKHVNPTLSKFEFIKEAFAFLRKEFAHSGTILICYQSENVKDEIQFLLDESSLSSIRDRISFISFSLSQGFFYEGTKTLVLSDSDLFSRKQTKTKETSSQELDLFAEQLKTLKVGDFVIHSDHGIGKYLGLTTMEIGGGSSDFLIIEYAEGDKVYLPIYRLNLIQKHSDASTNQRVESLRTNKFEKAKIKAKASIKTLAFDLLKLQAERESSKGYAFSPPDHLFKEFELSFPFKETKDQKESIDKIIEAMQKEKPLDHLVCGDVGFGKTEVAMRAAFKAVLDKKQVAILVPTTILAFQHFNSFKERFKDFAVNIDSLTRFKAAKEQKKTLEAVEKGEVDIIIGTHKLLGGQLKFKDLGLVIVDEEQRFGVNHKEKLKLIKSSVDFLTLTATPIPRTLQLSFLGLRDLSLIKTAPPKRQSIKTYLIKEDEETIQNAIQKELSRGGQVFVVYNRILGIEKVQFDIQQLVPSAKIVHAHGQMSEKELEEKMLGFYNGKYQILIATTIIESGLDIPNANTMIIYDAHKFGLSQLHQLRGRIGRSDKKAYAYFVIPKNKAMTQTAELRLKAIQSYADKGSGFNIASSDLEIRGAGDILGANQSGHIESIGLEFYLELLKEAISELKGEKKIFNKDIELLVPFPCFIPSNYIDSPEERLKQYKHLSNCKNFDELLEARNVLEDFYGQAPQELKNLFRLFEARINFQRIGLKSAKVSGNTLILLFEPKLVDSDSEFKERLIQTFLSRPKVYKLNPEYKVFYNHKKDWNGDELVSYSRELLEKLYPSEQLN